jgi:hypothetical protein
MIQSIIVYSLLMFTMILFAVYAARRNGYISSSGLLVKRSFWRFEVIFPLILFAIIFGMRYDVGVDHLGYLHGYLQKIHGGKNEPLFFLFAEIGWKLNWHYVLYFGVIAFAQALFFFYAFNNERYIYPFLVFFLFTNGEWGFWMNGIRQALAMCIWIFSIKYIEDKKLWKYLIWYVVATLIHKSAIVLIVFYPILRNGRDYFKSIPLQLILLGSAFVLKSVFEVIFPNIESLINTYINILGADMYERSYNIEGLMNSYIEADGTGLVYLFRIILNVTIILYSKRLKLFYNSKRFNIIYFFFFIGLLTMYVFPVGFIAITRPFRYFYIFPSIMYAFFLYYLFKTKIKDSQRGVFHAYFYYGLIFIFLGIFYLSIITSNENSSFWYQFYFDQNIYGYPNRFIN